MSFKVLLKRKTLNIINGSDNGIKLTKLQITLYIVVHGMCVVSRLATVDISKSPQDLFLISWAV
jgi:hypothetical protein